MNGSLAHNITKMLMPALTKYQGREGSYVRGGVVKRLAAVPTSPDWESAPDKGSVIEEYTNLLFLVAVADWARTGLGAPQQSDRFTVILADGVARTFALLPTKDKRAWELDATATNYLFRMKWVKA